MEKRIVSHEPELDQDYKDIVTMIYEELPILVKRIVTKAAVRTRKISILTDLDKGDMVFIDPFLCCTERVFSESISECRKNLADEIERNAKTATNRIAAVTRN
jgi:hypothetical protein